MFTAALLAAEITNDPAGIGYAPSAAAGADAAVAAALNLVRSQISVNREPIAASVFTALIDVGEFGLGTQAQRDWLIMLVSGGTVDLNDPVILPALAALFSTAGAPLTRGRLTTALTRHGSRAEMLWGTGTVVSVGDVSLALRGHS